jgi:hypothetical protein
MHSSLGRLLVVDRLLVGFGPSADAGRVVTQDGRIVPCRSAVDRMRAGAGVSVK